MLRTTLQANAASCALFGAIFMSAAPAAARFIGDPPIVLLHTLGAALLTNSALLMWTSVQQNPNRIWVLFFSLGDAVWVLATALLIVTGIWITTVSGIVASVAVAAFVGVCGVMQWRLVQRSE